ncbi:MAG: glycosyltransferase family 39 protein [Alphaproteobacteria bacterium]|nr:MAG: glycosyltransferase family 39 protein [Alphaproteobacteria bacterium]
MRRWRRLEAWVAAQLRERDTRAALIAIALFCVAGVFFLTGMKAAQDLFVDSVEAYAWGQSLLGGYGRHPFMTGWIAHLWYSVFPAADWASYALSRVMAFVTLTALYFIARRVVGPRRALFVVLAMMLYPLFHTKGERFNNYQVLLAFMPLLVLAFLNAYEKCTALSGALLGLAAAAGTLTIYSGLIGVAAVGLAALLHPDRMRFLRSPAPWVAALVCCVALTPHVLWLIKWDYPTLQWANSLAEQPGSLRRTLGYLGHHFALLAFPVVSGTALLWPWRRAFHATAVKHRDAFLILVITAVLVFTPPAAALVLGSYLRQDWGNPLFSLVPLALLVLARPLVTRRAVARAGIVAAVFTLILLIAAPIYPWVNYRLRPVGGSHAPYHEIAEELTRLWRVRFHSPLPLVVGGYEVAAYVVFYSPDHPKMYADFDPALSPWIDYPNELKRKGFVGACASYALECIASLDALDSAAEKLTVSVTRQIGDVKGETMIYEVRISKPGQ